MSGRAVASRNSRSFRPGSSEGVESQTLSVPSIPTAASFRPSGLKPMPWTMSGWPRRERVSRPVFVSQIRIFPSTPAVASRRPSGWNDTPGDGVGVGLHGEDLLAVGDVPEMQLARPEAEKIPRARGESRAVATEGQVHHGESLVPDGERLEQGSRGRVEDEDGPPAGVVPRGEFPAVGAEDHGKEGRGPLANLPDPGGPSRRRKSGCSRP